MSPALVMPYRKGNKTDRNDAEAILEAVTRPGMRFETVKSVAQQDLLALHRVRVQLVKKPHGAVQSIAWVVTRARSGGANRSGGIQARPVDGAGG